MPRGSPFTITLSRQEREALESHARKYTLPYFDVLRAKMILLATRMTRSVPRSRWAAMWSVCGANASSTNAWQAWRNTPARVGPAVFPPDLVVRIKAIACELPATLGVPLSRLSTADIVREIQRGGIVDIATISNETVWRWLHDDAIHPWRHRPWVFPRDPDFAAKAGRILDLYARHWEGARPWEPRSS